MVVSTKQAGMMRESGIALRVVSSARLQGLGIQRIWPITTPRATSTWRTRIHTHHTAGPPCSYRRLIARHTATKKTWIRFLVAELLPPRPPFHTLVASSPSFAHPRHSTCEPVITAHLWSLSVAMRGLANGPRPQRDPDLLSR